MGTSSFLTLWPCVASQFIIDRLVKVTRNPPTATRVKVPSLALKAPVGDRFANYGPNRVDKTGAQTRLDTPYTSFNIPATLGVTTSLVATHGEKESKEKKQSRQMALTRCPKTLSTLRAHPMQRLPRVPPIGPHDQARVCPHLVCQRKTICVQEQPNPLRPSLQC